ncbi:unnamed protein product [Staurois parvus]|uniref:Uncharacterized protein n=1 Tax=Staurois parvus TaxID=386267 RepID=A0ABN9AT54_9NEOB|nr:unnamed protein product [Staurois parvus]
MIQSPSRHIPCLLLENVPEFPAPLTSPVSSSIIFLVTSRIFCMLCLSGVRESHGGTVMVCILLIEIGVMSCDLPESSSPLRSAGR